MKENSKLKMVLSLFLFLAFISLFEYFGYLIANTHGFLAFNNINGALMLIGSKTVGLIIFCAVVLPFLKLKKIDKNDLLSGARNIRDRILVGIWVALFLVGFFGIGILESNLAGLYELWTLNGTAAQILCWGSMLFGVIAFYIFVYPYMQKESEASKNYVKSLDATTKEKIESLVKKKDKKRNIEGIIATLIAILIFATFIWVMLKIGNSEMIVNENSNGYTQYPAVFKEEPLVVAGLIALPIEVIILVRYLGKRKKTLKNLDNAITAEGTVWSCRLLEDQGPYYAGSFRSQETHYFEVLITVPGIDQFLRTTAGTTETYRFVNPFAPPPYEKGDRVKIMYDPTNPTLCRIIEKIENVEL